MLASYSIDLPKDTLFFSSKSVLKMAIFAYGLNIQYYLPLIGDNEGWEGAGILMEEPYKLSFLINVHKQTI